MATDRGPVVQTGVGASVGRVRWVAAAVLGVAFAATPLTSNPHPPAPATTGGIAAQGCPGRLPAELAQAACQGDKERTLPSPLLKGLV